MEGEFRVVALVDGAGLGGYVDDAAVGCDERGEDGEGEGEYGGESHFEV